MKITKVHFLNAKHIKLSYSPHMAQELNQEKWSFEFHGEWIVGRWKETGERLAWPSSAISHLEVEPLPLPDLAPTHEDVKLTASQTRRAKAK